MNQYFYHISSTSSKGSRRQPALDTGLEEGLDQQPGAFRVQGNRPPGNSEIISVTMEDSEIISASSMAEGSVIRVPEAQLVDPGETEEAIARAVEEAREQRERAVRAELLLREHEIHERQLLQQRFEQPTDRTQGADQQQQQQQQTELKEREKGRAEMAEEDRSSGFLTFISKHSFLSCALCSALCLGAVGAVVGVVLSSSASKNGERDSSPPTRLPIGLPTTSPIHKDTNEPTPHPTAVTTTSPSFSVYNVSSWTQVGSTLMGNATGDSFGDSNALALSSDGTILAVGASYNDEVEYHSGRVQVFQRQADDEWKPMGAPLNGAASFDWFGSSVALSSNGQILAVGARESFTDRPGYIRVFAYDNGNGQWNPRGSKIVGVAVRDSFGSSVALSFDGNKMAVGDRDNDDNGLAAGHVRVFAFDSNINEWVQEGSTLTGATAGDYFGETVDLSSDGGILAVGASYNDDNGDASGHVRAFQFNSDINDWDPLGAAIPGASEGDYFGVSVALSANGMVLAAGASWNGDNGSKSGHVRVFDYNSRANKWILRGSAIVGVGAEDRFGVSVALSADGNQVVAGAHRNDAIATDSGHIRVFQYQESSGGSTGQWKLVGEALTGVGGEGDYFGRSVSMSADGTVVAGGASESSDEFEGPGYVCVYEGVVE